MKKFEKKMEDWVIETQRFQKIAKVPISSREELEEEYKNMNKK